MKTILVDAWNTFVLESGMNKEMQTLLDSFPNKKIVVTNANPEEQIEFGMTNLPYELFTLNHEPNKTDPIYFKKLLQQLNLKPEDTIYFEHNIDAVKSAQSLGITAYHYDHVKKDLIVLKEFLSEKLSQ